MQYSVMGILSAAVLLIENYDILFNRLADNTPNLTAYRRLLLTVLAFFLLDSTYGAVRNAEYNLVNYGFIICGAILIILSIYYSVSILGDRWIASAAAIIIAFLFIVQLYFTNISLCSIAYLLSICFLHADRVRKESALFRREIEELKAACEKEHSSGVINTHIAQSLAHGCTDLFYVNLETEEYIEYHAEKSGGALAEVRRDKQFFDSCKREAELFVHPDDRELFVGAMDRRRLPEELDKGGNSFTMIYRRILDDKPVYVKMKASRIADDGRFVVISVTDVDRQVKQRRMEEQMIEERIIYARLHALTGNFICVYVVEPETGKYREFSATVNYEESFGQEKEGTDFFRAVRDAARTFNHPDDLENFLTAFTKKNVMSDIERTGIFTFGYRLLMDGKPVHVQIKAAMVDEKEGRRLVVGINDIDAQVRQEEEQAKRLAQAQSMVNIDALTGVNNKHAYLSAEDKLNRRIAEHRQTEFAIVMFDVNDLKKVNDNEGHQAGDQYLRDACDIICGIFERGSVYRIGGDEFAVIAQGDDYARIGRLMGRMNRHNANAIRYGGIIIACGMSRYDNDRCVAPVFNRADQNMYDNKNDLKADQKEYS